MIPQHHLLPRRVKTIAENNDMVNLQVSKQLQIYSYSVLYLSSLKLKKVWIWGKLRILRNKKKCDVLFKDFIIIIFERHTEKLFLTSDRSDKNLYRKYYNKKNQVRIFKIILRCEKYKELKYRKEQENNLCTKCSVLTAWDTKFKIFKESFYFFCI